MRSLFFFCLPAILISAPPTAVSFGKQPLYFEPNLGQVSPQVRFLARGSGFLAWITDHELVLRQGSAGEVTRIGFAPAAKKPRTTRGIDKQLGTSAYFIGNDESKWVRNVPSYAKALIEEAYPGIDVVFYEGKGKHAIEYDFIVRPGADPSQISIDFDPVQKPKFEANGTITLSSGAVRHEIPAVNQGNKAVPYRAALSGSSLRFQLGFYDRNAEITIDPVLKFRTDLGGSSTDQGTGLAVDQSGAAYLTGTTMSPEFPYLHPSGTLRRDPAAPIHTFVTKIAATAATDGSYPRIYSVFLGSATGYTGPSRIAVDPMGAAYVFLHLTGTGFPVRNAFQPVLTGGPECYLFKLAPSTTGPEIEYATFLGGSGDEFARAVVLDRDGNVYLAGETGSADFPQLNTQRRTHGGGVDVFVAMLAARPSAGSLVVPMVFSMINGGSNRDEPRSMTLDSFGGIHVAGNTFSANFPTRRAHKPSAAPQLSFDGFVMKIVKGSAGTYEIEHSTRVGGDGSETISSIVVDSAGAAVVSGTTSSPNLPLVRPLVTDTRLGCFLMKFSAAPVADTYPVAFSSRTQVCGQLALGPMETIRLVGSSIVSSESEEYFPLVNASYLNARGALTEFEIPNSGPARIVRSSYLESPGFYWPPDVVWPPNGDLYMAGSSSASIPGNPSSARLARLQEAPPYRFIVRANRPGFPFTVSGTPECRPGAYEAPFGFNWPAGIACTVTFASFAPGIDAQEQMGFGKWLDTGSTSATRTIVVPAEPRNYEAYFDQYFSFSASAGPFGGGSTTHEFPAFYKKGSVVSVSATPLPGYMFLSWFTHGTNLNKSSSATAAFRITTSTTATAQFTTKVTGRTGLHFVPLPPCRVIDTRISPPGIQAKSTLNLAVRGTCGVPANAEAYSLNVTVVPNGPLGYLTMYPAGTARPTASILNSLDGRIKATGLILSGGIDGKIDAYATDSTEIVVDVNGYFVPPQTGSLAFYPIIACRVLDTRLNGAGPRLTPLTTRTIAVRASDCGIPADAQAYSLNATVIPTSKLGYLRLLPTGGAVTSTSTLNALTGTVVANAAIIPAGVGGSIDAFATDSTDLVLDINGYFAPPGTGGLSYYPIEPCRAVDTRLEGVGYVRDVTPTSATVGFRHPVYPPVCPSIPTYVRAYTLNATVWPQHFAAGQPGGPVFGYLSLTWAGSDSLADTPKTPTSTLNAIDGALTSNAAIVEGPGFNGFGSGYGFIIIDITGFFSE